MKGLILFMNRQKKFRRKKKSPVSGKGFFREWIFYSNLLMISDQPKSGLNFGSLCG